MPRSPFDFDRGVTQWRINPIDGKPYAGDWVFTLGYDGLVPRIEDINIGDYLQVSQDLSLTGVGIVRAHIRIKQPKSLPNYEDISRDFQLIAETSGSPGNKIVIARGVSESDINRTVTVTGCTNGANNTNLKIVGLKDSLTAYVDKTVVTEGPRNAITAIEKGARWKFSLLVDVSGTPTERARVIQGSNEASFYRDDLILNVSKMSGTHTIYFRMTLIEHNLNNIYTLP